MEVKTLVLGPLQTNCYIISQNKKAIIIDPADSPEQITRACKELEVKEILVTHEHFDHVGALSYLENYYKIKHNVSSGNFKYQIFTNPGHTDDSISFYFPEEKMMFDGDFIFKGAIGRTDFPESNPAAMCESIANALDLPDDITLLPGHGPSTTLGEERETLNQVLKYVARN